MCWAYGVAGYHIRLAWRCVRGVSGSSPDLSTFLSFLLAILITRLVRQTTPRHVYQLRRTCSLKFRMYILQKPSMLGCSSLLVPDQQQLGTNARGIPRLCSSIQTVFQAYLISIVARLWPFSISSCSRSRTDFRAFNLVSSVCISLEAEHILKLLTPPSSSWYMLNGQHGLS